MWSCLSRAASDDDVAFGFHRFNEESRLCRRRDAIAYVIGQSVDDARPFADRQHRRLDQRRQNGLNPRSGIRENGGERGTIRSDGFAGLVRQQARSGLAIVRGKAMLRAFKAPPHAIKPNPAIGVDQSLDHVGRGERLRDRRPKRTRQRRTPPRGADSVSADQGAASAVSASWPFSA